MTNLEINQSDLLSGAYMEMLLAGDDVTDAEKTT